MPTTPARSLIQEILPSGNRHKDITKTNKIQKDISRKEFESLRRASGAMCTVVSLHINPVYSPSVHKED